MISISNIQILYGNTNAVGISWRLYKQLEVWWLSDITLIPYTSYLFGFYIKKSTKAHRQHILQCVVTNRKVVSFLNSRSGSFLGLSILPRRTPFYLHFETVPLVFGLFPQKAGRVKTLGMRNCSIKLFRATMRAGYWTTKNPLKIIKFWTEHLWITSPQIFKVAVDLQVLGFRTQMQGHNLITKPISTHKLFHLIIFE